MSTPFKQAVLAAFLVLCVQIAFAQTANFTSNVTEGCFPLTVNFTDASTGTVTDWLWDFGNNNTSTLENPAAIFSAPGVYNVSLTVSNNGGAPNTRIRSGYIVVHDLPSVDFSASPTSGCAPLSVKFSDQTSTASGAIASWLWVFGDGGSSTAANPTYVFKDPGARSVSLRVRNEHGCERLKTIATPLNVLGPTAKFVSDKQAVCTLPATFQFTNQTTGTAVTYQWEFGDGQTSNSASPLHTYNSAGTFKVVLKARDGNGCEHSFEKTVNAGSEGGLDFNASTLKVCLGAPIDFELVSDDAPESASWTFGDGNSSTLNDPTHTYTTAGTYTVTLNSKLLNHTCNSIISKTVLVAAPSIPTFTSEVDCNYKLTLRSTSQNTARVAWYVEDEFVSTQTTFVSQLNAPGVLKVRLVAFDAADCSVELEKNVNIASNPSPLFEPFVQQACTGNSLSGCAPFDLQFTNKTTSSEPLTIRWEFGDGGSSTENDPHHTFVGKGLYQVTLKATNGRGCSGTTTAFVVVENKTPVANFTVEKTTACAGDPIQFTDLSTDADFWCWDFGDGSIESGKDLQHKYQKPGKYTVKLTAKNAGCSSEIQKVELITIVDPHIDFHLSKSCLDPYTINLDNNSENYHSMHWEFGDGQTSTTINVGTHQFAQEGIYEVKLIGKNNDTQCEVTARSTITIQEVEADFDVNTDKPCIGAPLDFTDKSHAAVKWEWNIGGQPFVVPDPATKLTTAGTFAAQLKVTDSDGCQDIKSIPINVLNMQGDFSYTATSNCEQFTVNFKNKSSGTPDPDQWQWNFGDGDIANTFEQIHTYQATGKYTVSLSVSNSEGTCVFSKENAVVFTNPIPSFESEKTEWCPGDNVVIANTTKNAVLYEWDYGDGRRSDFVSPTIPYTQTGSYDITLFALDAFGCEKKLIKDDFVIIGKPTADFSVASASGDCPPFTGLFSDESKSNIEEWQWDFGDGQQSTLQHPANVYLKPGNFNVTLSVTDDNGCIDTKTANQFVTVEGPTGSFAPDRLMLCTNETVAFAAAIENTETLRWDFGDGNVIDSRSNTQSHLYGSPGSFTPQLLLIDERGCQTVADGVSVLQVSDTTAVSVSIAPDCIRVGEPFAIEGKSDQDNEQVSWSWSIDGIVIGSGDSFQASLEQPGMYVVTGHATNKFSCVSNTADTLRVQGPITMIPNVITPNGDGDNESFKIIGLENSIWNIDILNRWGNTVYKRKGYIGDWNGEQQPAGVYYYVLRNAVCEDRDYKGFISIVR